MDVLMPDGTLIQNVPEGTTKAQLQAKLSAPQTPELPVWEKSQTQFAETGGGAALGRPVRNVAQVQPEPRPLESALAGITKSAVIDPVLGTAQLLSGGNVGSQAAHEVPRPRREDWRFRTLRRNMLLLLRVKM